MALNSKGKHEKGNGQDLIDGPLMMSPSKPDNSETSPILLQRHTFCALL